MKAGFSAFLRRLSALASILILVGSGAPFLPGLQAAEKGRPAAEAEQIGKISFLVLGDWGRQGERLQREVAGQMGVYAASRGADFVITVGDNFYENGVRSIDDRKWQSSFHDVYTAPSLDIPWYAVLGNHDYRGSADAQIQRTDHDERWKMPGRYYSLERPVGGSDALFVFLDTNPFIGRYRRQTWRYPDLDTQDPLEQLRWLDEVLGGSMAAWKIVVGHHPVFSGGAYHGPTKELMDRLRPVLEKHGVQVYLSGHDHNLQLLKPPGPTHYVVSGAGSRARKAGSLEHTLFARGGVCGFVAATLTDDRLNLEYIDHEGGVLYESTIVPRDGSGSAPP